jgi:ribosomal RNA-processing protein 9
VLCLALSDDSRFLVSGGKDRLIKLWDGATYEPIETFKGHRDSVTGLGFQRGRHLLFSASADRSVKVWNLDDMAYMDTLFGHTAVITDLDCYLTERALTCGNDCSVRLWKTAEGSQLLFHGQTLSIDCVRIINHEWFVSGSQDGSVGLWKTSKKKPSYLVQGAHGGKWVTALAVLPNSDLVASGSYDGWINLYQFTGKTLELKGRVVCKGYVNALAFTRDGQKLVAGIGQDYKYGRWTPTVKTKFGFAEVVLGLSLRTRTN